jgi:FkbM family methyltransferase
MSITIKAHTSIIGETGYNCHSRNFFKALNSLPDLGVQVRNWTVGSTWEGYNNDEPHNSEYYIDYELKAMLTQQTLKTATGSQDFPLYQNYPNLIKPDVHIVLNDVNHDYFNDTYIGPKIAYNVWETTKYPETFFNRLKTFDQVWVPSEWQKLCTIDQGIPSHKVKIVPEGVDTEMFKPLSQDTNFPEGRPFRFVVVGRWEYRKSTKEIIKAFIDTFSDDENVELILNVENPFSTDNCQNTQERLDKFGLKHSGIKILSHLSKEEYVTLLQTADVFISCARSEGWNLPLIEAMASGTPSIYSNWGAQLQFAEGKGVPVKVHGEVSAAVANDESWNPDTQGNFVEPDFADLAISLREVYDNYEIYKKSALMESEQIRTQFTWDNAAKIAQDHIQELLNPAVIEYSTDFAWVTCGNLGYMPIIQKLAESLLEFSTRKLIVYGIDCDVPFSLPNVISHRLKVPNQSIYDKWYWKQYACIEAFNESPSQFIWLDGDIIANHTIDKLADHFSEVENYPLADIHVQEDFIGYYTEPDGSRGQQLFNENLCKAKGVNRLHTKAHICMYLYNRTCEWWFNEILEVYKQTGLADYPNLLQWNDEGIDNYLRCKYGYTKFLPVSNFDVSEWDGDLLGTTGKSMEHFISFWRDQGPKNFGKVYGWQFIPKNKDQILYFHGNKNLGFAQIMIDYVKAQRDGNFHDTEYFFVAKDKIKNLGSIKNVQGGTMDIAHKYGWDYAIYHEIYNLTDYEYPARSINPLVKVKPGDVVVDLGGNIGIFTRYAYHMGASKIITFEPDRRYFEILKQNAPANAVLFNAAIGDQLGTLTLTESSHLGGSNLWHQKDPTVTQYDVNLYTLDYILETGLIDRIDFLKVDIEGSELIALKGISDENLSKIRNVAVEYHHEHLNFNEDLRNEFISRFNRLGFNSYLLFCGPNNALQLIYFWK